MKKILFITTIVIFVIIVLFWFIYRPSKVNKKCSEFGELNAIPLLLVHTFKEYDKNNKLNEEEMSIVQELKEKFDNNADLIEYIKKNNIYLESDYNTIYTRCLNDHEFKNIFRYGDFELIVDSIFAIKTWKKY